MDKDFYMDVPAVQGMSRTFNDISEVFETVSKALEVAIMALRASAFISFGASLAKAQLLEQIKPVIDHLADKTKEISGDLNAAAISVQNGDALGSTKFHR